MAVKSVSIRFEKEMPDKLNYVAEYEGRSLNSRILVLARESIKAHEEKYEKIRARSHRTVM